MTAVLVAIGGWLLLGGAIVVWLGRALRVVAREPKWIVPDTVDGLYAEVDL